MAIVVNNNNNCDCLNVGYENFVLPDRRKLDLYLFHSVLCDDSCERKTFIRLACLLGWSGWHFFYAKKPILAITHIFLVLIGLTAVPLFLIHFASIDFVMTWQNDRMDIIKFLILFSAAPVSWLIAVISAIRWSCKSDAEFNECYHK